MTDNKVRQPTDRARALRAVELRTAGCSYRSIAEQLGYRDPSGAYRAVSRLLDRREHESVAQLRTVEGKRLDELQAGLWPKAKGGDLGAVREVVRIMERRARLFGADAPLGIAVEGIDADTFAARAAELLKVTGIRPLVEAALPALPPAERAAWLATVDARTDDDDDGTEWSNLGTGGPVYGPVAVYGLADDTSPHPDGSERAQDDSAPRRVLRALPAGDDEDQDDAEPVEVVEVIAELVEEPCGCARPSGQRAIAASEILDADGVPIARSARWRRYGYDPLRGWR